LKITTTDRLTFHHINLAFNETEKLQLTQGGEDEGMPAAIKYK